MRTKTIHQVFCSECKKHIRDCKTIPFIIPSFPIKLKNSKQPYIYELFKTREDGITQIEIEAFCCEKCRDKFVKRFEKKK